MTDYPEGDAAMSVETSNAPAVLHVAIDAWLHQGGLCVAGPSDDEMVVEYVRRDLVVPTVEEAILIAERMSLEGYESYDAAAKVLRSALLSRIEGDNEPTGDCETDCTERCRGECGDLAASGGEST